MAPSSDEKSAIDQTYLSLEPSSTIPESSLKTDVTLTPPLRTNVALFSEKNSYTPFVPAKTSFLVKDKIISTQFGGSESTATTIVMTTTTTSTTMKSISGGMHCSVPCVTCVPCVPCVLVSRLSSVKNVAIRVFRFTLTLFRPHCKRKQQLRELTSIHNGFDDNNNNNKNNNNWSSLATGYGVTALLIHGSTSEKSFFGVTSRR